MRRGALFGIVNAAEAPSARNGAASMHGPGPDESRNRAGAPTAQRRPDADGSLNADRTQTDHSTQTNRATQTDHENADRAQTDRATQTQPRQEKVFMQILHSGAALSPTLAWLF